MKTPSSTKDMASPKPNSNNDMQTTQSCSSMRSIKVTLNFWMNYEESKTTTALQISYRKYLKEHQLHNPSTKICSLCLNQKLEIARYKGHNLLDKRSQIINKCPHRNKLVLALYDSKDWIKFSVTSLEQPCMRNHSCLESGCFTSSCFSFPRLDWPTAHVKSIRVRGVVIPCVG